MYVRIGMMGKETVCLVVNDSLAKPKAQIYLSTYSRDNRFKKITSRQKPQSFRTRVTKPKVSKQKYKVKIRYVQS